MRENDEPGRGDQGDGANRREEHGKQRDRDILSRAQRSQPMPQVLQRKLEDVPGTSIIPRDRKTRGALDPLIERKMQDRGNLGSTGNRADGIRKLSKARSEMEAPSQEKKQSQETVQISYQCRNAHPCTKEPGSVQSYREG